MYVLFSSVCFVLNIDTSKGGEMSNSDSSTNKCMFCSKIQTSVCFETTVLNYCIVLKLYIVILLVLQANGMNQVIRLVLEAC